MEERVTFGIIGCGNLGGVMAEAVAEDGICASGGLLLADILPDRSSDLAQRTGGVSVPVARLAEEADIILLAVKPQDFARVAEELKGHAGKRFLSVMAGKSIEEIRSVLGTRTHIARVMPNICARVGRSVNAVSYCEGFPDREFLERMLSRIGEVLIVDEGMMDAVTAISGSGPAYFVYFAECLFKNAVSMGFGEEEARKLVQGTFSGTAELMERTDTPSKELLSRIASRGGTTEAALHVFEQKGLCDIVSEAVWAALKRAGELSGGG